MFRYDNHWGIDQNVWSASDVIDVMAEKDWPYYHLWSWNMYTHTNAHALMRVRTHPPTHPPTPRGHPPTSTPSPPTHTHPSGMSSTRRGTPFRYHRASYH